MKITLNFEDVKKLIEESFEGINDVNLKVVKEGNDLDILLDVDGDNFKKKNMLPETSITINNPITKVGQDMKTGTQVDYDTLLATREVIKTETIIPEVKSLDEKNEEASSKGLMTAGRGSSRPMRKF